MLLFVIAVAGAAGYRFARWRVFLLPVPIGFLVAGAITVGGGSLRDTPLPFFVVSSVIAAALGGLASSRGPLRA